MNLDDASTPSQLAAQSRVVVIGGGIAGLVAALECAKIGMRVTLVEASTRLGGTIRSAELAGLSIDVGTKCFSTRGGIVPALVAELGLSDRIEIELHTEFYETARLGVGDAVYFDSTMGHAYIAAGDRPAKVLAACSSATPNLAQTLREEVARRLVQRHKPGRA